METNNSALFSTGLVEPKAISTFVLITQELKDKFIENGIKEE